LFTVGGLPADIEFDDFSKVVYVANKFSDTVSVIDGTDYSPITNITVGGLPADIEFDDEMMIAYVANAYSNSISAIYGGSQKVVAGVSFDVNPSHGGRIECDNITVPTNQYLYIDFRTGCIAQPQKGFQFSSWIQNLEGNLSRPVNASTLSDSPLYPFYSSLGIPLKDTAANLMITRFGNFTAKFEKLPPPIPAEYLIPLYGVIASSIVGWSIPSIVGWVKAKRMGRTSNAYHKRINSLYDDGKLDYSDIESLDKLRSHLSDTHAKGKISDQHYQNLKNEISVLYEEIHRKRIDSLNGRHDRDDGRLLHQIKDDIEDAFAKGKISEQHYNLLNKKIESFVNTNENKTSEDKSEETANQTHITKRSPI
jgi:YVTN family beta-propeller protein